MSIHRRDFLSTAATGATIAALSSATLARAADSPNEKIVVGIMGSNGRGRALAKGFAKLPGTEVAYVCDVDENNRIKTAAEVEKISGKAPKVINDFQQILDDQSVDALVVATPDHWHGPATILGCSAGKHVYVEKPASHNPNEGEMMLVAARKHSRVVQVGTQRRSYPSIQEAMSKLHGGEIGKVLFSRSWYNNQRPTIGIGKVVEVPKELDFKLWQGPAPVRDFKSNILHYNWHWFWHWGTGELGNNGIHALDLCRWGLQVDYPTQVTSGGGKYRYEDDQETPDTQVVTFDFGDRSISWEGRSWSRRGFEGSMFGASFYGEKGSMVIQSDGSHKIYNERDKLISETPGGTGDHYHLTNFLDCIRENKRPNADIEIGHRSTLLCQLGNIAHRTKSTLNCDPKNGHILGNKEAEALWGREYQQGWEPKV